ncbi:MAG TPA: glycine zipper 2TM domain-containing protein [Candidatus Binatia bacterium]|nr:glycine zipper 2TM domain-containing protein [Candidatus Binatia bacterium]
MNKLTVSGAALGSLLLASPVFAHHDRGYDYARVVSAEPIVRQVRVSEPRDECFEEPVRERTAYRGHPNPGAMLIGGIIGGVIGHQFGGGHGRDVATAAGAVIGAHAGATHGRHYDEVDDRTVYRTRCRTTYRTHRQARVEGYDVTYRYHGRLYHTRMPYDPGERIKVRVDVAPVDYDDLD